MIGNVIYALAKNLFNINRSITGEGVRKTLHSLKKIVPGIIIKEIPTGTQVFDWTIPKEWKVNDAYIITPSGKKICNFKENNLHLIGYSIPVKKKINFKELNKNLHSLPKQPNAIPYITSYYKKRWGFCMSHKQRKQLKEGNYEVFIDSKLFDGSLSFGELIIKGELDKEIFISTYVCHPSMANDNLSGPTVTTFIAKWLLSLKKRKYTYRIIFIPETIGSIAYLKKNFKLMKKNIIAGFNVTCIGDNRAYSYLPSRKGNTLSDLVVKHILKWIDRSYKSYKWADRGSDERQYCSPGIDLPIASIMRTKYGKYPEYHTSLDNLTNVVTPEGLNGGYNVLKLVVEVIEKNCYPKAIISGEPHLGKRGLYPTLSTKTSGEEVESMMNLLTWADGKNSLIDIAEKSNVPVWKLYPLLNKLKKHKLI